jgi:hypothetical protein
MAHTTKKLKLESRYFYNLYIYILIYIFLYFYNLLNVVFEWLTFLLHIREVPGSNLNPETDCPDTSITSFSSVPPSKYRDSALKLGHDRFLPNPFNS